MADDRLKPQVAFIGTGLMGGPMAMRVLSAGYPLAVWNRTREKTRDLAICGARVAEVPAGAVAGADIVIMMLIDGAAVTNTLFEDSTAAALQPGCVVVDMSSIPPFLAREHAAQLAERGIHCLDAPVSGGTKGAEQGTLAIMVGGDSVVFESISSVLEAMGRPTLIGGSGCGQLAKLANQAIVAATIGAVAEALLLTSAAGADPAKVSEALAGGFADSMILKLHGERMLNRAWVPGGRTRTQVKDLRSLLQAAASLGLELPLSSKVTELFEACVDAGFGEYDHSALLLELERINPGRRVGSQPDRKPSETT